MENITSLNVAIEKAKTIKIIRGEDLERRKGNFRNFSGKAGEKVRMKR